MTFPMGSPGASNNAGTGPSGQRATSDNESSVEAGLPVEGSVQDARADAPDAAPELPATGDQAVDAAVETLLGVLQRPLGEQVEVYADVHGRLQDRLADLDG